ncbi:MAG TPA: phosphopyruvate hydratase [Candidatus Babeliales bacterium]|nr:phosphopyruvate hydratase [Candidatus Babeliales bacterium]
MKIAQVIGREIFDSRGIPTIECDLFLEDGSFVTASVPSGASRSGYEAVELRDGGERLMGQGVLKAIENLQTIIAPVLIGQEPDVITLDSCMIELDGTENKSRLGANAILAASIAVCKAQAMVNDLHVYELIAHLCEQESVAIPFNMFNVLNGGVHGGSNIAVQECMIIPTRATTFRESLEQAMTISHTLKAILIKKGKTVAVGDEGGFAPLCVDLYEALDLIMEAIHQAPVDSSSIVLALDIAASQFYDTSKQTYAWGDRHIGSQELIQVYKQLCERYPIYSIEDGLAEIDYSGWKNMMVALGEDIHLVGDDIFSTNMGHIERGIKEGFADAVIIKPNQIGTVKETLQTILFCKGNELSPILSHRSGETNDDFLADLAVGASAGLLKAGGCSRGERMAKYNRLLQIEDDLLFSMFDNK